MMGACKQGSSTNPALYQCRVCGNRDSLKKLQAHFVEKHLAAEEAPFYCRLCIRGYVSMKVLKQHVRRRHPDADPDKTTGSCTTVPRYDIVPVKEGPSHQEEDVNRILANPTLLLALKKRLADTDVEIHAPPEDVMEAELSFTSESSPTPEDPVAKTPSTPEQNPPHPSPPVVEACRSPAIKVTFNQDAKPLGPGNGTSSRPDKAPPAKRPRRSSAPLPAAQESHMESLLVSLTGLVEDVRAEFRQHWEQQQWDHGSGAPRNGPHNNNRRAPRGQHQPRGNLRGGRNNRGQHANTHSWRY